MAEQKKYYYHLLAMITVIIWGTTFVSTKVLIQQGLSPVDIFFFRFFLAYVFIFFFSMKKLFSKTIKDELLFALLGFSGGSFYFITENTALEITLTSNVSLILCTAPILTAFLTYFFHKKEKISKNLIIGSVSAFFGVALVVFNGSFILDVNPLGDFLTLLASLSWAFYGIILKQLGSRYTTIFITRKVFFYGILTLLPFLYYSPLKFDATLIFQPKIIANLLFLGIIASLLCFVMWNVAVKKLGVIRTTNYIYMVPLVTLITSSIILKEKITLIAIIGSIFILAGVYIAENGLIFRKQKK